MSFKDAYKALPEKERLKLGEFLETPQLDCNSCPFVILENLVQLQRSLDGLFEGVDMSLLENILDVVRTEKHIFIKTVWMKVVQWYGVSNSRDSKLNIFESHLNPVKVGEEEVTLRRLSFYDSEGDILDFKDSQYVRAA